MASSAPTVFVLAGPNGAGKTSLYLHEAADVPRLNGDNLYQQGVNIYAIEAALRQEMESWLQQRASFVIETNAASERDYALFGSLQKSGYRLECRFVCLRSVRDCQERVIRRVLEGGHDVPAALIQHRYDSGLSLLKRSYRLFDRLQLYDNSGEQPEEVAEFLPGSIPQLIGQPPEWAASVVAHIIKMEALYTKLPK
ncbi:putative ABC-type ATPase [Hymenobacter sp. UYAg731]